MDMQRMMPSFFKALFFSAVGMCIIFSPLVANAALVAAYSFNEGTGTTVADASGNGNTGTIVGATWTTAGKYGNALSFNGTSSYVNLGNPTSLRLTGSMTLSAWVLATGNPPDDGQIIAKSNNSAGWQLKTSPDTGPHTFGIAISPNSSSHVQRYSTTVRSLNTWYHVAGVYNAAAQTLNIYVNGVLDSGTLIGTVPASQFNSTQNVNIGRRSGGFYFQGTIDEVRVYNTALTQAQIQADMNTPIGGTPPASGPDHHEDARRQLHAGADRGDLHPHRVQRGHRADQRHGDGDGYATDGPDGDGDRRHRVELHAFAPLTCTRRDALAARAQLSGDHPDGERGRERARQRDQYGHRVGWWRRPRRPTTPRAM